MTHIYSLLWYLLLPFLFIRLYWRGRLAPDYRKRWHERLARGYRTPALDQCVWLHAVSVGEFLAALPIIEALLERHPQMPFLVTTTTPTGSARVKAALGDRVHHVYCPWELPTALNRFMRHFKPALCIIMETELWPNLTRAAAKHNCKLVLANARLSEKSYQGYARIPSLVVPLLRQFSILAVQSDAERLRFIALGANANAVHTTGSIKFDLTLTNELKRRARELRKLLGERPIWLAASTHPPEEALILDAHRQLLEHCPNALLIWVPRHPERFSAVASLITSSGLTLARRSDAGAVSADHQVYLADTMGELLLLYGVTDVALVGGSLDQSLGGHNLLEPAAWGKPVISGVHLTNFLVIAEIMEREKGLIKVTSASELATSLSHLLTDEKARQQAGAAANQVVAANRGALQELLDLLESYWPLSST